MSTLAPVLLILFAACAGDGPVHASADASTGPSPAPAPFRSAAFILDVSAVRKTVKITAPTTGVGPAFGSAGASRAELGSHLSLLGGDVIDIAVSNYAAGAVGAVIPGKVLITFDLTIHNRLVGIALTTPTFPTPPAGVTGVQAFPFEVSTVTTTGGVAVNGSELVVTSPRSGIARASNNWDGPPHNFFNDVGCTETSNDCFRYEAFGVIPPRSASAARQVGFLVDPSVGDLRIRLILAADLQPISAR